MQTASIKSDRSYSLDTKLLLKAQQKLKNLSFNSNILEICKTFGLLALPHLAILVIYLIYILVGASIIQEIEQLSPPLQQSSQQPKQALYNQEALFKYLDTYEKTIIGNLDRILIASTSDDGHLNIKHDQQHQHIIDDEKIDVETLRLVGKLIKAEKKMTTHSASNTAAADPDEFYRKLIKYFLTYKDELKMNFNTNFIKIVTSERHNLQQKIESAAAILSSNNNSSNTSDQQSNANLWSFRKSLYYVTTLLTTIGYGDMAPKTKIGKLFTIVYAFIGIPLTLILLQDLGSLFTRFLKFLRIFIRTLYNNGYFDTWINYIKNKNILKIFYYYCSQKTAETSPPTPTNTIVSPFNFFKFTLTSAPTNTNKTTNDSTSTESTNYDNESESTKIIDNNDSSTTTHITIDSFESFMDMAINCYEQTNDSFDFSFGILLTLTFAYLTFGAVLYSHFGSYQHEWSLLDGYYYSFVTVSRIGFGDLVVSNTTLWLWTIWYTFVGVAFFMLIFRTFHGYIKNLLVKNGKKIICDLIRFAAQLGYKMDLDDSVSNLSSIAADDLLKQQPSILQPPSSSADTSTSSSLQLNSSGGELSVEDFSRQHQQQRTVQMRNSIRRRSSFLHKRTSILKDFNPDQSRYSLGGDVPRCDKQTQITTLLCTTYSPSGSFVTTSSSQQTAVVKPNKNLNQLSSNSLETIKESSSQTNLLDDSDTKTIKLDESGSLSVAVAPVDLKSMSISAENQQKLNVKILKLQQKLTK